GAGERAAAGGHGGRAPRAERRHRGPRRRAGVRAAGGVIRMTTFSVLVPFMPQRPEQVLPLAALVRHSAAYRLRQGQSLIVEPHQAFTYAAASGFRVPCGTGVTLMPFRHPLEAAMQARSVALATGQPMVAGFGPGGTALQGSMLGAPYASPLTAVREYV